MSITINENNNNGLLGLSPTSTSTTTITTPSITEPMQEIVRTKTKNTRNNRKTASAIIKVDNGIKYYKNGWMYISIYGTPKQRGYAYGLLIGEEFKEIQETLRFLCLENYGHEWEFYIDVSTKLLKNKIEQDFPEYFEEMYYIAQGIENSGHTHTTIDEIIAWNNYFLLTGYWEETPGKKTKSTREGCSAFICVGDYSKDGGFVSAHNNFSEFIDGQFANQVLDIQPDNGFRMLIQGFVGWIWSGTDFFVSSSGIFGTETTIGGFQSYVNKYPLSCRIRKAMQYGNTLDDYVNVLLNGNSGDYANIWLFGDTKTNEIMSFELGLKYHSVRRTTNGYFISFNAPYDPKIRNLECVNTGFNDIRRHQGARKVRLEQLMEQNKGIIDIEIAKKIISDHYDVYLEKENPCSRSVCSHYDEDAREFMSQSDRPFPYQPRGALDGNVIDSTMAKNMSFLLKWGRSCDIPFISPEFFNKHLQWKQYEKYIKTRENNPWTIFTTYNHKHHNSKKLRTTKTINNTESKKGSKKNKTKKSKEQSTNYE